MSDMKQVIEQSFTQYAGSVLQSRALIDVRDCLKPSARQIFYCLYTDKFLHNKPFKKTLKAIGSVARMYIHGDSSAEGVIMRAGQDFAMRYPLVEIEGNYGSLMQSGNWAAPRYTASRLSSVTADLFQDIDKQCIAEWRDNYDDTEKYPTVLPSKGFYNIVNGTTGIGIGAASSIPQFNIVDVNNALIKLLQDPNVSDDEIICVPDFATGAILLNESEVRESLKNGQGRSCILRSVVNYDEKEKCFIVTEIPYGVYTNTICQQLEQIISEGGHGIDRFNDLTGSKPLIKIYLSKHATPERVLKYLFKETSLQYYYGINMTMLENGRFPRVFTWREALQAHIDHEKTVYRKCFEYDLHKIEKRLHILDGLIICLANIDEVVQVIKGSSSSAAASLELQKRFALDEAQAKAVLDMKLSRLARLEVQKLEQEIVKLNAEKERIIDILNNEEKFNQQLIDGWNNTSTKLGDARRTKVMNLQSNEDEPIEKKSLIVNLTNKGTLYAYESSTLYTQRRGGKGIKAVLPKDEFLTRSISEVNNNILLLFTNKGKVYSIGLNDIPINELTYPANIFNFESNEYVYNMCSINKEHISGHIIFTTKKGLVKKTLLSEYNLKRCNGVIAIKLKENDEIVNIEFGTKEQLGILTLHGNFVKINIEQINATGRVTSGVQGIKLNDNDYVIAARLVPADTKYIMSASSAGLGKITPISEFDVNNRATKGNAIQKLKDGDTAACFLPIPDTNKNIIVISNKSTIKIPISQVASSGRHTIGTMLKKTVNGEKIISLIIED